MRYLSAEEILRLHFQVVKDYGGAHGIRDESRLLSVIEAPKQRVFGQEQYSTVFAKAAVYLRNLILDHPFIDGNKRTAVTAMAIFLKRNGYKLTAQAQSLEDFIVKVATERPKIEQIAAWLKQHTKKT